MESIYYRICEEGPHGLYSVADQVQAFGNCKAVGDFKGGRFRWRHGAAARGRLGACFSEPHSISLPPRKIDLRLGPRYQPLNVAPVPQPDNDG